MMIPLDQIVDRKKQLNEFKRILRGIYYRSPISVRILEWHGTPGIGKTQLVHLAIQECNKKKYPSVLIDFHQTQRKKYERDPSQLIDDIVSNLTQSTSIEDKYYQHFKSTLDKYLASNPPEDICHAFNKLSREKRIFRRPIWLERWHDVIDSLDDFLRQLSTSERIGNTQPVVFIFDETEYANSQLVDWIEEWVFKLVISQIHLAHCLIIWTGRRSQKWKNFNVRYHLHSENLLAFPEDVVKKQLKANGINDELVEDLFPFVYSTTRGHPYGTSILAEQFFDLHNAYEKEVQQLIREHRNDLVQAVFEATVENRSLREYSKEIQIACNLLAMVRIFDARIMLELLPEFGDGRFENWLFEDFQILLRDIKRTQLIAHSRGYMLEPDLRNIIHNYYSICQPDLFKEINLKATAIFQKRITNQLPHFDYWVVEELYHRILLQLLETPFNLKSAFDAFIENISAYCQNVDDDNINITLDSIIGCLDEDTELYQLTNGHIDGLILDLRRYYPKR